MVDRKGHDVRYWHLTDIQLSRAMSAFGGKADIGGLNDSIPLNCLLLPQKLGQPGDIRCDPLRLIAQEPGIK
jgi:hypothetical protein